MNLKSSMVNVFAKPMTLTMMLCLAGCQQTLMTRTSETDLQDAALRRIIKDLCTNAWKPQTYSSRDTEETRLEARARNAARAVYCSG